MLSDELLCEELPVVEPLNELSDELVELLSIGMPDLPFVSGYLTISRCLTRVGTRLQTHVGRCPAQNGGAVSRKENPPEEVGTARRTLRKEKKRPRPAKRERRLPSIPYLLG